MKPMTALVLQQPHTHAGKTYAAGDRLEADPASADWLVANGIARPVLTPDHLSPEPKSDPKPHKEVKP